MSLQPPPGAPPGFKENYDSLERTAYIITGVVGGLIVLSIIGVCICCLVPVCYFSSQSRERRRSLRAGNLPPPPAYPGQPGGGQFGGQQMYNTAHPSQQQFAQSPGGNMQSASGLASNAATPTPTGAPPPYPVQQSQSAV